MRKRTLVMAVATLLVGSGAALAALQGIDIGSPTAGSYVYDPDTGTHTVTGNGYDIWDAADDFHFAYEELPASEDEYILTVEVTSLTGTGSNTWQKAGLMVRDTLTPGSMHSYVAITSASGYSLQGRTATDTNNNQNQQVTGLTDPIWLRLAFATDTFTGYYSNDGVEWTQSGQYTYLTPMTDPMYYGLAVTSHEVGALSTAVFRNFDLFIIGDTRVWDATVNDWEMGAHWSGGALPDEANRTEMPGGKITVTTPDAVAYGLVATAGEVAIAGGQTLTIGGGGLDFAPGAKLSMGLDATLDSSGPGLVDSLTTSGSATINIAGGKTSVATYDDGGVTGTLSKQGGGVLALDDVAAGAITFHIRQGTLETGGSEPLGGAQETILEGGTLLVNAPIAGYQPGLLGGTLAGNMNRTDENPGNLGIDPLGPSASEIDTTSPNYTAPWAQDSTILYTGEVYIGASGFASFYENVDDNTWLLVDGETILDNTSWNTPTAGTIGRAEGWYDFELRMSNGGGGAGAADDPTMGFGYSTANTASTNTADYVHPQNSDATTADLFRVPSYEAIDLTGITLTVKADSILDLRTDKAAMVGTTIMEAGTLITTGAEGGITFVNGVTVAAGAEMVGFNALVPTDFGGIDASAAPNVVIAKGGPGTWVLAADPVVGAPNSSWAVVEGTLELDGADPIGGRAMAVSGGTLRLAGTAPLNGAPVTLDGGTLEMQGAETVVDGLKEWWWAGSFGIGNYNPPDGPSGYLNMQPQFDMMLDGPLAYEGQDIVARVGAVFENSQNNPDDPHSIGGVWFGQMVVGEAGSDANLKEGPISFGSSGDDYAYVWVDRDQSGTYDASNSNGVSELIVTDNWDAGGEVGTINLAAGTYNFAVGWNEGGGGEWIYIKFGEGTHTDFDAPEMALIDPSDPNQAGIWQVVGREAIVATDLNWTVEADSTINAASDRTATFSAPTLKNGVLTITGAKGGIVIEGTNIDPDATLVGYDFQVPAEIGAIDGNMADVIFVKDGPVDLVLEQPNVELDNAAFEVRGGLLKIATEEAWGGARSIRLGGGTFEFEGEVGSYEPGLLAGHLTGDMNRSALNPGDMGIDMGPSLSETSASPPWAGNSTFVYTGEIYDEDGIISFRENIDDKTWLVIDGQTVLDDSGWNTVTMGTVAVDPGWHTFELRMSNGGGGAGVVTSPGFGYDPTGGTNYVWPQDPGDGSLFRTPFVDTIDMTDVDVTVTGDSTLRAITDANAAFGPLTLAGGVVTLTGADQGYSFTGTTVAEDATTVGLDLEVAVDLKVINVEAAQPVLISKTGDVDLVLTSANVGSGFAAATFEARGGRLIGINDTNPFDTAALSVAGGELVLGAKEVFTDVTYDNALSVTADGTLTAGAGGVGGAGPLTVTLGSAANGVEINGKLDVRSTDDYSLKVAGAISGAGTLTATEGSVTLAGGGAIDTLKIAGGELTAEAPLDVNVLNVTGGVLSATANINAAVVHLTGGVTNTNASQMVISDRLSIGGTSYQVEPGSTFTAESPNLAVGGDLTIDGGTFTITGAGGGIPLEGLDIGSPPLEGLYQYDEINDVHSVVGGGHDIWDDSDDFHFAQAPMTGDAEIIAHVASHEAYQGAEHEWGKAGVMIRDTLEGGSVHRFIAVTPGNGVAAQGRIDENTNNNINQGPGGGRVAPYWVRLVMEDDLVTQYRSADDGDTDPDDVAWEEVYSDTIALDSSEEYYIGLAVTSHDDNALLMGTFDNVLINGIPVGAGGVLIIDQPGMNLAFTADTVLELQSDLDATLGNLTLEPGVALVADGAAMDVNDVNAGDGASIESDAILVRGTLSPGAAGVGTLTIDGELEFDGDDTTYLCSVSNGTADRVDVTIDAYPAGTLELHGASGPMAAFGEYQMTILQVDEEESEVIGEFDFTPAPGDPLGTGLFALDPDGDGEVVSYDGSSVKVDVFQAAAGDTNGDRDVNNADLQAILGAGSFGTGEGWAWGQGDFNGDGLVNNGDLQLILATGLFGTGTYAATAGGSLAAVPEPGSLVLLASALLGLFLWRRRK